MQKPTAFLYINNNQLEIGILKTSSMGKENVNIHDGFFIQP